MYIEISPTFFGINTPSSHRSHIVLAKFMNYKNDKML